MRIGNEILQCMVARIYNKLNVVIVLEDSVCIPLHTVLEQCSKYFRTVNGAAPRKDITVMHQSFEIPAPPTSGLPEAKAGKSPCFHHFNIPL